MGSEPEGDINGAAPGGGSTASGKDEVMAMPLTAAVAAVAVAVGTAAPEMDGS